MGGASGFKSVNTNWSLAPARCCLISRKRNSASFCSCRSQAKKADRWFEHALDLEQSGAPFEEIIAAYQKAAELDPNSAGALVNLGTVFFNGHAWGDAEQHYKKALEIDPRYALAHFNLGNLYDEQNDPTNALEHYHEALRLHASYADAHYNLALLYQGLRELKKLEATTVVVGGKLRLVTKAD